MKDRMTFYKAYYEAIRKLNPFAFKKSVMAILEYGLNDKKPRTSGVDNTVFQLAKNSIDNANNRIDRTCKSYREWREKVFFRDNYTCQECGAIGGKNGVKLQAHHKKEFAKNKELRFDVKNGITLCVKCHKKIHRSKKTNGK